MSSSAPQFPVLHRSLALDVKGHKTELVLCSYEDHFLIVASQIGAFGTILHARKEEGVTVEPTFSVSVEFGKRDEPMMVAFARQLIDYISKSAIGVIPWSEGPLSGDCERYRFCSHRELPLVNKAAVTSPRTTTPGFALADRGNNNLERSPSTMWDNLPLMGLDVVVLYVLRKWR